MGICNILFLNKWKVKEEHTHPHFIKTLLHYWLSLLFVVFYHVCHVCIFQWFYHKRWARSKHGHYSQVGLCFWPYHSRSIMLGYESKVWNVSSQMLPPSASSPWPRSRTRLLHPPAVPKASETREGTPKLPPNVSSRRTRRGGDISGMHQWCHRDNELKITGRNLGKFCMPLSLITIFWPQWLAVIFLGTGFNGKQQIRNTKTKLVKNFNKWQNYQKNTKTITLNYSLCLH